MRRGHGSPPVLSEVPHELSTDAHSKECKRSPQQFVPAGFPLHDQLPTGTEDSAIPLTTPDMVRSGRVLQTSVKSNLYSKLDDFPVVGYEKPSVVKLFSFTCIELFASGNVFILRMPENKGRNMETLGKLTGLFHCAVMLLIGIKTLPVTI